MDEKAQSQVFHGDRLRRLREAKRDKRSSHTSLDSFFKGAPMNDFMEKSHTIRLMQPTEGDEEQIKMLPHLISQ